jgi:ketosteroid isomerase-like protein
MKLDEAISRFCDAWNRHAADDLAAMWTGDGELNHPWGVRAVGRDAIAKVLGDEHRGSMAASKLELAIDSSDDSGDTVTAELAGVVHDVRAPNGRTYDLPLRVAVMFTKHNEQWLIRTMAPVANPK